jgi:hypothetical protein
MSAVTVKADAFVVEPRIGMNAFIRPLSVFPSSLPLYSPTHPPQHKADDCILSTSNSSHIKHSLKHSISRWKGRRRILSFVHFDNFFLNPLLYLPSQQVGSFSPLHSHSFLFLHCLLRVCGLTLERRVPDGARCEWSLGHPRQCKDSSVR